VDGGFALGTPQEAREKTKKKIGEKRGTWIIHSVLTDGPR